jgi:ribosomal protein L37AE/L43A
MLTSRPNNLIEIDELISAFLTNHQIGISSIHRTYFRTDNVLSLQALIAELMSELRTGCVSFNNRDYPMEELDSYLFYIVNDYAKRKASTQEKKKPEYICPGCLFLGQESYVRYHNYVFKCHNCSEQLKKESDAKKAALFRAFARHSKRGYHCLDCDRFIPNPLDESTEIFCPYLDCCFVGSCDDLKKMHHPSILGSPDKLILDSSNRESGTTIKDTIASSTPDPQSQLEIKETLRGQVDLLRGIIESQKNSVYYSGSNFTSKHKELTYQAFHNLLHRYPTEMVDYLLHHSRSGGFQHKVFQEYISLLEDQLPFTYKKGKTIYRVESLLDPNLGLFNGISTFEAIVNDKLAVKNGTKEFYIGGRKGTIAKPYYIGKLLNVVDKKNKKSLLDQVSEYTFSLLRMQDIDPGTEVVVKHLRIPPHYQMGGMVYVNRIRKKIVDRATLMDCENEH